MLREAVSNLIRHSGGSRCRVEIAFPTGAMTLSVEDDGRGMDVAAMGAKGNGLGGIERRALIPELVRDSRDLTAVLSRYAQDLGETSDAEPLLPRLKPLPRARGAVR